MERGLSTAANYVLYQTGWLACVLGGAWGYPWTGFSIAAVLLGVHLVQSVDRAIELRLVLLALVVGLLVETSQIAAGTYTFTSGVVLAAWPPPWLLAMWAQFATTFRFSLRTILARPRVAAAFGAVGGPIAFVAGERLGAIALSPDLTSALLRLSLAWTIALLVFAAAVRRLPPTRAAGAYRGGPCIPGREKPGCPQAARRSAQGSLP